MTTIQPHSSRLSPPRRPTARWCAATTLLCAVACVAAGAGHGIDPTATPDGTTISSSSARGGVSQMSAMKAEG